MKILVVDDEALARLRIIKLLTEAEITDSIFQASSGKDAIKLIRDIQPDLVFLDIQMTDMTGFDVLKKMDIHFMPIIIFVTAFDNFAVKAFEVQAFDFLLKPFKKDRFFEVLERGISRIQSEEKKTFNSKVSNLIQFLNNEENEFVKTDQDKLKKIVLKVGSKYYFVDTEDVKYIISSAYYAEIYTKNNEKHIYRISMTDFIKKLNSIDFIRVNRSSILKISEIKEIISEGLGDYSIKMKDNHVFILTKKFKNSFLKTMNIKN